MAQDHFKMLPAPRDRSASQATSDARTGGTLAPSLTPQVDGRGAEGSDFKTWVLVYQAIVEHQRGADWWTNCDDLKMLRDCGGIFIKAFDLRVKDAKYMAMPLIRIEPMNVKTIGTYRAGADGYAIVGSIAFNQERLLNLPVFLKLVLLLKCLLCAWQHQKGGDGTFDRTCRESMKAMGLVVTAKGAITIDGDGPFRRVLEALGIEVPVASVFPRPDRNGKTTNRLWSCTCQKCRVGTNEFFAVCPQCGEAFRLGDHVGKRFVTTESSLIRM
jgi:hypothetical protein